MGYMLTTRISVLFAAVLLIALAVPAFSLEREPDADYHARRVALGAALKGGVAILYAADEPSAEYLSYRQDEDFYYLTGWNEPGAALVVIGASVPDPTSAAPVAGVSTVAHTYREILFLPTRNKRLELYTGVKLDASSPDAVARTGVSEVKDMTQLPAVLNALADGNRSVLRNLWVQQDMSQGRNVVRVHGCDTWGGRRQCAQARRRAHAYREPASHQAAGRGGTHPQGNECVHHGAARRDPGDGAGGT